MVGLDAPTTAAELYLARGAEVEPFRPILTGDVFAEISIPGVEDDPHLAMVIAHPCSMRAGPHLRSHVQMARVVAGSPIGLTAWDGNYGVVPLPALMSGDDMSQRAVLELAGRVRTDLLVDGPRVATLDTKGILLVGQRIAFNATRAVIDLHTLWLSVAHVLEEADLLEEWMRARLDPRAVRGSLQAEVRRHEESFDAVMRSEVGGETMRGLLLDPVRRPTVRRHVMRELNS